MQKKNKNELIRIVKNKNGEITVDKTGKKEGRGIYICQSIECLEKAIKSKRIEKSFETKIYPGKRTDGLQGAYGNRAGSGLGSSECRRTVDRSRVRKQK